ncbi:MAG: DUF4065 domain-containing protein [Bifidobacterium sp.]|nr:DUF4065 domain-containing protein [Bifidobacterium sp.]
MAHVIDVAAYVLEHYGAMTTMKMQKLVFYAQANSLSTTGKPLFPEEFEAWRGGPVCRELYQCHRGKMIIRPGELPGSDPSSTLTVQERAMVDAVCGTLHTLSGNALSARTHAEDPWRDARGGLPSTANSITEIPKDAIREYYRAHPIV